MLSSIDAAACRLRPATPGRGGRRHRLWSGARAAGRAARRGGADHGGRPAGSATVGLQQWLQRHRAAHDRHPGPGPWCAAAEFRTSTMSQPAKPDSSVAQGSCRVCSRRASRPRGMRGACTWAGCRPQGTSRTSPPSSPTPWPPSGAPLRGPGRAWSTSTSTTRRSLPLWSSAQAWRPLPLLPGWPTVQSLRRAHAACSGGDQQRHGAGRHHV